MREMGVGGGNQEETYQKFTLLLVMGNFKALLLAPVARVQS